MHVKIWAKTIQDERNKHILETFGTGDDFKEVMHCDNYVPGADADIIFGSWKDRDVPHHNLKREVVKGSKNLIVIETPLLERGPVKEIMDDSWFRVGLNGFMRNGLFAKLDDKRRINEVEVKTAFPKRIVGGDYILVVLQLPGDASLDFTDINQWCEAMVDSVRSQTDRDIVVRYPQLKRNYELEFLKKHKHIYIQNGTYEDRGVTLENAYAVLTYSSGMGVEAILNGNRTYVGSKNGFYSRENQTVSDVLEKDYQNFASVDHQNSYIDYIKSTQWHADEIKSGACWEGMKGLING